MTCKPAGGRKRGEKGREEEDTWVFGQQDTISPFDDWESQLEEKEMGERLKQENREREKQMEWEGDRGGRMEVQEDEEGRKIQTFI